MANSGRLDPRVPLAQGAAGKERGHHLFAWLPRLCPTKGSEVQHVDLCTSVPLPLPSRGAGVPSQRLGVQLRAARPPWQGLLSCFPHGGTQAMGERPPTLSLTATLEPLPQHPEVVHHDPPEEVSAVLKGDLQLIQHRLLHLESVRGP